MADYVIIMGYDEHYAGGEAGPVSSISFVDNGIKDTLEVVPKEKVINAIPFYTRLWTCLLYTSVPGAEAVKKAADLMALVAGSQIAGVDAVKGDALLLPGVGDGLDLVCQILAGEGLKPGVGG